MSDEGNKTLQDTFGDKTADKVAQNYAADSDLSKTLLADLRALLQPSATARRLLQMGDEQGVPIKFLRGREEAVYVPENKWIFMSITPRTRANARLALLYAGALREAEQNLLGFSRPGTEVDDDTWVTQNAVKNLDIIRNMCIIVREIVEQNQSDSDFLDSLRVLGHDEIYKGLINKSSDADLLKLYAKKEQLETKEG